MMTGSIFLKWVSDEAETADGTKENDAKEVIKPSKVRAMAASLNNTNNGEILTAVYVHETWRFLFD